MGDFIDYVTKDKYGKPRTTERALLAICKVLDTELPLQKEGQVKERTRLKNAREDIDYFDNNGNLRQNRVYKDKKE